MCTIFKSMLVQKVMEKMKEAQQTCNGNSHEGLNPLTNQPVGSSLLAGELVLTFSFPSLISISCEVSSFLQVSFTLLQVVWSDVACNGDIGNLALNVQEVGSRANKRSTG